MSLIIEGLHINEASNIKRNKALIKQCTDYVYNYFKERDIKVNRHTAFVYNKDIKFDMDSFVTLEITKENIIVLEDSKGRINIGIDTSKCEYSCYSEDVIKSDIARMISYAINDSMGSWVPRRYDKKVLEAIIERLKKDGEYDNFNNYDDLSGSTIESLVRDTKIFKDIFNVFSDKIKGIKAWLELDDDAFKYLTKNRKFIPVMIIDLDNGTIDYSTKENPGSDRKARDKFDISSFVNSGDIEFKEKKKNWWYSQTKYMEIPSGLCHIEIDSKYLDV